MPHERFKSCIDACNDCALECDHCAHSCLQEADPKPMARCIGLDTDCAQICRLAAGFMARASELSGEICATCAEVCEECAAECERHDMEHCRRCARACRRCAEECRRVAQAGSRHPGSTRTARPAH